MLCPVECIGTYKEMTKNLRNMESSTRLIITHRKPHKPVATATVARWIKDILNASGIDTDIFKAHSSRGAATSAAKLAGVSGDDILATANWSTDSTFNKFYFRSKFSARFAKGALGSACR